jgi:hypothetical protein
VESFHAEFSWHAVPQTAYPTSRLDSLNSGPKTTGFLNRSQGGPLHDCCLYLCYGNGKLFLQRRSYHEIESSDHILLQSEHGLSKSDLSHLIKCNRSVRKRWHHELARFTSRIPSCTSNSGSHLTAPKFPAALCTRQTIQSVAQSTKSKHAQQIVHHSFQTLLLLA